MSLPRVSAGKSTVVATISMLSQASVAYPSFSFPLSPLRFQEHTRLFNGNVLNTSKAVVLPIDAQDVSQYAALLPYNFIHTNTFSFLRIIIFCNKHGLSPSIKAGGYGTGGWAINGDVVIDLSKIQDVDIEPPQQGGGGYTSLRDTALSINKGKARVGEPVPDLSGPAPNRLLEGDSKQIVSAPGGDLPTAWLYSAASATVANFLQGPALQPDSFGEEPRRLPVSRPRLDLDPSTLTAFSLPPIDESITSHSDNSPFSLVTGSGSSIGSSVQFSISSTATGRATLATTPESSRSPHSDSAVSAIPPASPFGWAEPFETAPSRPDPFAYMDSAEPPMMGVSPPTSFGSAMTWGSDAALLAHPVFAGDVPAHLTRPVPPHTHAYISFGAGAKQKDVDTFTAENPLEGGIVPYHIPL